MAEEYDCPVCGKHFAEEEDYENHKDQDHPEVKEFYGEAFSKEQEEEEWNKASPEEKKDILDTSDTYQHSPEEKSWDELHPNVKQDIGDELEKQEDKPVQTHDEWQKELEGLKDEFSSKEGYHMDLEDTTQYIDDPEEEKKKKKKKESDETEDDLVWDDKTNHYVSKSEEQEDEEEEKEESEEGGADEPLAKVFDLSESYRFLSKDSRAEIFESIGINQKNSNILSGLEWNELTKPIKTEASEAYVKGKEEKETGEDPEDDGEDKVYEHFYNLEENHASPDYKKKAITCTRCNESFYNGVERDIHFNEFHAKEQEYSLPEACPFCGEEIQEPNTLDWHMQEEHGAHVPSQFTQTGIVGAMADTDIDSLESHKATESRTEQEILNEIEFMEEETRRISNNPEQYGGEIVAFNAIEEGKKEINDLYRELSDARSKATEEGIPYSALEDEMKFSQKCYDWEGYETDCETGEKIGQGYSQSKSYQKFLNENLKATEQDEMGDIEAQAEKDWWERGFFEDPEWKKSEEQEPERTCKYCGMSVPTDEYTQHIQAEHGNQLVQDWQEEGGPGSGRKQGYAPLPEQIARAGDPHYDPYRATPPSERLQTDPELSRMTEDAPDDIDSEIFGTEDSTISVAGPPEGTQPPANMFDDEENEKEGEKTNEKDSE